MGAPRQAAAAGEEVRLLLFGCGGERFALDVAYVREILPGQEITPVPFVPPSVAGIINHRGTIYTLIRFSRLAGLRDDRADGGVVLLRLPEMAIGIAVESVEGIERLPVRLLAPTEGASPPEVPFLRRASDGGGRLVHAIDADVLVDTIYQLPELARSAEH